MSHSDFLYNRPRHWIGSVWKKYSYRIYKLCLQKCATKDEADDLFQEVALRFCKNARKLNNQIHLFSWFQTVLLHCHYNECRKGYKTREIPISCLCEPKSNYRARAADAYRQAEENLRMDAVMDEFTFLLEMLNPLEKMIVELTVIGGLSIRELSRLIGLSRGSIVHRRNVAFKKMETKMMAQKNRIEMITGRDASLREIIECAG